MEKPSRLSATSPRSWHRTSRCATPTNSTTVNSPTGRRRRTPGPYLGPSLQRHRVSNRVGPPKRVSAGCCAGRTALGMGRTPPLSRRRTRGWFTAHHLHPGQASLVPHGAPAALLHRQPLQAVPYRNRRTPPVQLPRSEIPRHTTPGSADLSPGRLSGNPTKTASAPTPITRSIRLRENSPDGWVRVSKFRT